MSLSDKRIKQEISRGNIIIEPYDSKYQNPVSVDLTLKGEFKVYDRELKIEEDYTKLPDWVKESNSYVYIPYNTHRMARGHYEYYDCLDVKNKAPKTKTLIISDEGYVLIPGKVYLYACNEKIGVNRYIRSKVEGKSSLGRLGLFVHVTAGFIDPGFEGSLVLELVATEPIRIYKDMKICQVEFSYVEGEVEEAYNEKIGSKYMNQVGVQESKMGLNFKENDK